jgi:acetate kinase
MKILVLNCGSSSIKYQLFNMPAGSVLAKGSVQRIGEEGSIAVQQAGSQTLELCEKIQNHEDGLLVIERMLTHREKGAIASMKEIAACGHRVVHGGETFTGSVNVTADLEKVIEEFSVLAPLHNPPNLTGIRAAKKMLGEIPQVACFDTAFHQTIPEIAYLYALPYEMYEKHRIRRYGFHGTSHKYVTHRASELLGRQVHDVNLITCHLGNGCSMTAVKNGMSVDTSMGFTPLEGLVMGTRTGDIDPAIIFHLVRNGYTTSQIDTILNKKSGLLGVSGISNDVRDLEQHHDERRAKLALDIFAYRIRKTIGAYLSVLNGCDAIVFTGGIGENGASMRHRILAGMDSLGIMIDTAKNAAMIGRKEGDIGMQDARIRVLVVPTDEEAAIARDTFIIASEKSN